MTNQTNPSSTTALEHDFRDFASAALKMGAHLLEGLHAEQVQAVEAALGGGARLQVEFGPVPAFEFARLVLVEAEGARHPLTRVSLNRAPPGPDSRTDAQERTQ